MNGGRPKLAAVLVLALLVLLSAQCGKHDKGGQASVSDAQKQAHEKEAALALSGLKQLLADGKYDQAIGVATGAAKEYADTSLAGEFSALLKQAEEGKKVQEEAAGKTAVPPEKPAPPAPRPEPKKATPSPEPAPKPTGPSGPPRLAVAEFSVLGDVSIPEAGRLVSEWLLARFDARKYRLVDRTALVPLLSAQGLTPSQIAADPALLALKTVRDIRYLVVGTVSQLGSLGVSARMIDAATGEIVQSAEISADDPGTLKDSMAELAAVLQMTNEEKTGYLEFTRRQREESGAADAEASIAAERERLEREAKAQFERRQHERDAMIALTDIKVLLARGELEQARQYAAWASREYADTSAAREIGDLLAVSEAAVRDRMEAELRERHRRFLHLRDRGVREWDAGNIEEAVREFRRALEIEDDPRTRRMLEELETPGLAVLALDVSPDSGLKTSGRDLAGYLLDRLCKDGTSYRAVDGDRLEAELRRLGLKPRDAAQEPADERLTRLKSVRYLVTGRVDRGSVRISARMLDVLDRKRVTVVQTAEVTVENPRDLQKALSDVARMLQMSDREKRDFLDQLHYDQLMERGDAAASAGDWKAALADYQEAHEVKPTKRSASSLARAENGVKAIEAYDTALAEAEAAAQAGDWKKARDAYQRAAGINKAKPALDGILNANKHIQFEAYVAKGDAAAKEGNWQAALGFYSGARAYFDTPELQARIAEAKTKLGSQPEKAPVDKAPEPGTKPVPEKPAAEEQKAAPAKPGEADKKPAAATISYETAMAEAEAAAQAGDWKKARDAYQRALGIKKTPQASNGVLNANKHIQFDVYVAKGDAAAKEGNWQAALGFYSGARAYFDTPELQARIAEAKKKLEEKKGERPAPAPAGFGLTTAGLYD